MTVPKWIGETTFVVPDGVEIVKDPYGGHGLISTKCFKEGDVIYSAHGYKINVAKDAPDETYTMKLLQDNITTSYDISMFLHTVKVSDSSRILYTFDGFMNHSCDPTTVMANEQTLSNGDVTYCAATKDIDVGTELTCDYNLFDYECNGHTFTCGCKSPKCYGYIGGFKHLPMSKQVELLHTVDEVVRERFATDNPDMIIIHDNKLPSCVSLQISEETGDYSLRFTKNFKKGDIIFENDILFTHISNIVLMKLNHSSNNNNNNKNKYFLVDNIKHTVNRRIYREFYYFDIFTNHSCNPNAEMVYTTHSKYNMVALRDIDIGDELTNDYTSFDVDNDSEPFECNCKSANCKKMI